MKRLRFSSYSGIAASTTSCPCSAKNGWPMRILTRTSWWRTSAFVLSATNYVQYSPQNELLQLQSDSAKNTASEPSLAVRLVEDESGGFKIEAAAATGAGDEM